jgi:Tfp pilus assembly protein FimT
MVLTEKKAVRIMMPICGVQMPDKCLKLERTSGLTLIELLFALALVSLFVGMAAPNLFGLLRKSTFRSGIRDFVSTMEKAVTASSESNRRYEVIIDIDEQTYFLRQITSSDLTVILDEEIIIDNDFSEKCLVSYVFFDDGEFTNEGRAKFRAGHGGWQYGGKIVLLDEDDNPYTVVVNRINRTVQLHEGDIDIALPRRQDEVIF